MANVIVKPRTGPQDQSGFTLVEAVIALMVLMVVVVGVLGAFTYSTTYNTGNSKRSQALSVLQKEVELMRSAKFLPQPTGADSFPPSPDGRRDLTGGVKPDRVVTSDGDGTAYLVQTTVDDDPYTAGVQVDAARNLKEITVTVTPRGARATHWEVGYRATAVFRRVRSN